MRTKEKALELYTKYETLCRDFTRGVSIKEFAKESALVAANEMIEMLKELERVGFLKPNSAIPIIEEVKQEIEKL